MGRRTPDDLGSCFSGYRWGHCQVQSVAWRREGLGVGNLDYYCNYYFKRVSVLDYLLLGLLELDEDWLLFLCYSLVIGERYYY